MSATPPTTTSAADAAHALKEANRGTTTVDEQITMRLHGLIAGGFAGFFAKTATAPFDRVKILCQAGRSESPLIAMREVYSSQGVLGFWKGNMASVARIIPNRGVLFMTRDFVQDMMRGFKRYGPDETPEKLNNLQYVCAGSISGGATVLATYPLDLIRGRMTGHMNQFTGVIQTFRSTVQEEGWRTLYRGMSVSLLGSFPYEGMRFGVYDILKSKYTDNTTPLYYNVLIGAIAGLCATCAVYPNDTVRRRLQVQLKNKSAPEEYYKGGWDCYKRLYQQHGIKVFYRGCTANLARAGPSAALQFGSFEFIKKTLAQGQHKKDMALV